MARSGASHEVALSSIMDFVEFKVLADKARSLYPGWFLLRPDRPATRKQIADAESALGIELPADYVAFLVEFGGGDFAYTNVFSVDPESIWNIVKCNGEAGLLGGDFVGLSDDEAGGVYGYRVQAGNCAPGIGHIDLTTGELSSTPYVNSLSMIASLALRHDLDNRG